LSKKKTAPPARPPFFHFSYAKINPMNKDNIEKEFHKLIEVIETAGVEARSYFYDQGNKNEQKSDGSVLTEIDTKTEKVIRGFIAEYFPDDTIIGEEGDDVKGTSGFVWFIDPIDGTENFVRKIPFFSITATRLGPTPEDSLSIVHNPASGQTFASLMEDGVYENKNLMNLTADTIGGKYMINVTSGKGENWYKSARYSLLKGIGMKFGKSASLSSGLLEYAYVASGRIDGYLSLGLPAWDSAAGLYLVKAAGGAISKFEEGKWNRYVGPIRDFYGPSFNEQKIIFVSHPDIHQEVLDFVGDPKAWADK
jgi:myo-inositol-1(or 4)-monophosphatase